MNQPKLARRLRSSCVSTACLLSFLTLSLLPGFSRPAGAEADRDFASYVDPFIGTDAHGHTYPGATLPFGMVQLSPDTRLEGWDGCSGYHYSDTVVYGFSHTHLSGTGVSDYGDVLLMPSVGEIQLDNGAKGGPDTGYASRFEKRSERAEAGYYAVRLADPGIDVELTTTERTGFHRYGLPADQAAHVVVDLRHRDQVLEADMRITGEREIEGMRRSTAWAVDQVVYFVARFSRPFDADGFVGPDGQRHREMSGEQAVGALTFSPGDELLVQVGISAVDIDGARANLEAELGAGQSMQWDFDAVRAEARATWNESLAKIQVQGGSEDDKEIFYTGIYHSLLAPNLFSDVDGRYRGMDRQVHRAEGRRHYTVFSLWDTFRATHPLYNLIERERSREFVETFLAMFQEGGRLPVWELAGNETECMIGYHSVSVMAEADMKGIPFDREAALGAMVHSAELDHFGLEAYKRQGFIGSEDEGESVSKTLEYAYDDFCIARLAGALGKQDLESHFLKRSQGWRHLLDPETGFMRPKRNQRFVTPFDPARVDNHYTEANSWQYSLFVPHDTDGLITALGGDAPFEARLDGLFTAESETTGRHQVDITGLIGQYAHGNEPSHHMAWLYHHIGRPDKSADRVREITSTLYSTAPDGLSGNEDCGQMSSWYVFAAMGLYPVNPCVPEYVIAPPIFDAVSLDLDTSRFTIRRQGQGRYVASAELGGEPLERSYLTHDELMSQKELVLHLSNTPSDWGRAPEARPASAIRFDEPAQAGLKVPAAPYAVAESDVFRGSQTVELKGPSGARIHVAVGDGDFALYESPLVLDESTELRFFAELGGNRSPTVESSFHRIPHDWKVSLTHEPNASYTAGGADALIDGLEGIENWRTGRWQGYQYSDFEATVDLGEVQTLESVGARFLQDVKSWIWMPDHLAISVATEPDGPFQEVARLTHAVPDGEDGRTVGESLIRELVAKTPLGTSGRYLRFFAKNKGPIPKWHPGHGDRTFIFVDELLIELAD